MLVKKLTYIFPEIIRKPTFTDDFRGREVDQFARIRLN